MKIIFDLEGADDSAMYGLYAGIRMFMDYKGNQGKPAGAFSLPAAENYIRLQELKEQYPEEYAACEKEYESIYANLLITTHP